MIEVNTDNNTDDIRSCHGGDERRLNVSTRSRARTLTATRERLNVSIKLAEIRNGVAMPVHIDELRKVTHLEVGYIPPQPESTALLSSLIGKCEKLKELRINLCSGLKNEISNCKEFKVLKLENCMNTIELPQEVQTDYCMVSDGTWITTMYLPRGLEISKSHLPKWMDRETLPQDAFALKGLIEVQISYGDWNERKIRKLLRWLAKYVPNLKSFKLYGQTREIAKNFMDGILLQNHLFLGQFKDKLECLEFEKCNLNE
jgi:hypothetical protein